MVNAPIFAKARLARPPAGDGKASIAAPCRKYRRILHQNARFLRFTLIVPGPAAIVPGLRGWVAALTGDRSGFRPPQPCRLVQLPASPPTAGCVTPGVAAA